MTVQLVTRVPTRSPRQSTGSSRRACTFLAQTRSEAVVEHERRDAVGRAIVEGHRRIPPDEDGLAWSDAAGSAMIAEEPW
ncbi:MAG TPA: hypothetical protein VK506_04695 [Conexibacter sp.]|nr:hypothetical protein [Conexibacter sp.]